MARLLSVFALLALILGGACLRVAVAEADPGFDVEDPVGMLRSDPALLYYITERVAEAEGLFPDDLRADPRVEHPRGSDLARDFTLGQEFLVGWSYRALGVEAPLHVHAQRVMAFTASLIVLGVFLLARAATGRVGWSLFAATLAALLPANYRTIGFVLVREDLSLALFALHAGLAAMASRRGARLALLSGVALAGALATWHAMTFVVLIEAAALFVGALMTSSNALAGARGRAVLLPVVLAAVLVPALRSRGFLFSPPMVFAFALAGLGWWERGGRLRAGRRAAVAIAMLAGLGLASLAAARVGLGGAQQLSHVYQVLLAKITRLGVPPADPSAISFDARLLWQGPFETLPAAHLVAWLSAGLALGLVGAVLLVRGRRPSPLEATLLIFALVSLPGAWLVGRMVVLAGLALPVLAAVGLARLSGRAGLSLAALGLVVQGGLFAQFAWNHEISWYRPRGVAAELRSLTEVLPQLVPEGEAVCADFVNSTAVLVHTRRPIVLHPKYETESSRRSAEAFLTAFFHGTPETLAEVLRERFRCRYLLVDRYVLGKLSAWTAGLAEGVEPTPGTAAAAMLAQDPSVLTSIPGYELIYRSPPTILQSNGEPYDLFRLYRLAD